MNRPNQLKENPIKDNRIVKDKTFAIRLLNFIKHIEVIDLPSEEEKDYLMQVAKDLIDWQCLTVMDKSEKEYLERLNLI